jgi:hypothetical protein
MGGCARDIVGNRPYLATSADTSAVTAEVARSLTSSGLFVLRGPLSAGLAELSEDQVRNIARIWVKQFFPWVRGSIETDRGAKIDPAKLTVCSRVYYAESPYQTLDEIADGGAARRAYGPWWLVPLCIEGVPQVLLGVSSYATEIEIQGDQLRLSNSSGTEFVWRGIPMGARDFPVSPERATQLAAQATGSRIASIPRLVMPHFRDGGPALARWELMLTPAVRLKNTQSGSPLIESRLFVGPEIAGQFAPILLRAAESQPYVRPLSVWIAGTRNGRVAVSLKRKPTGVVRFVPAEV